MISKVYHNYQKFPHKPQSFLKYSCLVVIYFISLQKSINLNQSFTVMLVKYELTIANKSLIDIESIIHYTRPLTCEKELIKNFKKRYGKQLISVNILSVNDKVNFNYANTSKFNGMNGIFGTYRFNTIND